MASGNDLLKTAIGGTNDWIDQLLGSGSSTLSQGSLVSADDIVESSVSNPYTSTTQLTAEEAATTPLIYGNYANARGGDSNTVQSNQSTSATSTSGGSSGGSGSSGNGWGQAATTALGVVGTLAGVDNADDIAQGFYDIATDSPNTLTNAGKGLLDIGLDAITGSNPLTALGGGMVSEGLFSENPDYGKPVAGMAGAYGGALAGSALLPGLGTVIGAMIGSGMTTDSYVNGAIGDSLNSRENEDFRDYVEKESNLGYSDAAAISDSISRYDKSQDSEQSYDNSGSTGPTGSGGSVSGAEPVSQRGYTEQDTGSTSVLGGLMSSVFGGGSSSSGDNNVGGEKGSSTGTGGGYNMGGGEVSGL